MRNQYPTRNNCLVLINDFSVFGSKFMAQLYIAILFSRRTYLLTSKSFNLHLDSACWCAKIILSSSTFSSSFSFADNPSLDNYKM